MHKRNRTLFVAGIAMVSCIALLTSAKTNHPPSIINPQQTPHTPPAFVNPNAASDSTKKGLISFKTALDNQYYVIDAVNRRGFLYAEVKSDSFTPPEAEKRTPLNISIVIDRSGSMGGAKLNYTKQAAKFVVDNLSGGDYISIVTYESEVQILSASAPVTDQLKIDLKRKIDQIQTAGSTKLSAGMKEGFRQVESRYNSNYVNRVLLMSDGLANKGKTAPSELKEIVRIRNKERNMTLSSFGVGLDYNEDLMQMMAEEGAGNYYFISRPDEIPQIFEKELNSLLAVTAKNLAMSIELPQGVKFNQLYGHQYQLNGNKVELKFPDVFSKENKAVLLRFDIENAVNGELVFNSRVTFEDVLDNNTSKTLETSVSMLPTSDTNQINDNKNLLVQQQIVLNHANELMAKAMKQIDEGDYDGARATMATDKAYIDHHKKLIPFTDEMVGEEALIERYTDDIREVETLDRDAVEMIQKATKETHYKIEKKKELDEDEMTNPDAATEAPKVVVPPPAPKKSPK